jgi:hypothetical protein
MPGTAATIALLGFLPLALITIALRPTSSAGVALVLASAMFLPPVAYFDVEGFPPLGKSNLPFIYIALAAFIWMRGRFSDLRPGRGIEWLFVGLVLGSIGTVLTNRDPVPFGNAGLTNRDIISLSAAIVFERWLPFLIGRMLVRNQQELFGLLRAMMIAGLVYSLLCLIEIRLSPQLHPWVYGGQASPFWATRRFGGYRPNVFMHNGLEVGTFMASCLIATSALTQTRILEAGLSRLASAYLALILVLVKSSAAIVYGMVFAPLVVLRSKRVASAILAVVAALIIAYPTLRSSNLFPTAALVRFAGKVSVDRAESLAFRFENEDLLLDHAFVRPWFGWGLHARHQVKDEWTGESQSTVDGYWIALIGSRGVFAFLASFGLMLIPVLYVVRRAPRLPDRTARVALLGTAAIVVVQTLDWLPNGIFSNLPLFIAGALWTSARAIVRDTERESVAAGPAGAAPPGEEPATRPPTRGLRELVGRRRLSP